MSLRSGADDASSSPSSSSSPPPPLEPEPWRALRFTDRTGQVLYVSFPSRYATERHWLTRLIARVWDMDRNERRLAAGSQGAQGWRPVTVPSAHALAIAWKKGSAGATEALDMGRLRTDTWAALTYLGGNPTPIRMDGVPVTHDTMRILGSFLLVESFDDFFAQYRRPIVHYSPLSVRLLTPPPPSPAPPMVLPPEEPAAAPRRSPRLAGTAGRR